MKAWVASLLVLASCAAQAQQWSYVGSGEARNSDIGMLQLWGRGGERAGLYPSNTGAPAWQDALADHAATAMSPYTQVQLAFGYDAGAAPTAATSSYAWYAADDLHVTVRSTSGSVTNLQSAVDALVMAQPGAYMLSLMSDWSGVNGPLPGAAFGFQDPAPPSGTLDLLTLMPQYTDTIGSGAFDVSGLGSLRQLPVRVSGSQTYAVVGMSVNAFNFGPADPTLALPSPIEVADFPGNLFLTLDLQGVMSVAVDPADYASFADYERARGWVNAHVRQLNYLWSSSYSIHELSATAVPEPGAAWLLGAGTLLLAWRARRRP